MLSRQNGTGVATSAPFFFMLILLAESKTMGSNQNEISSQYFSANTPVFENIADREMAHLVSLKTIEIAEILKISNSLAAKAYEYAYEFPNKTMGYKALFGFIGDAYRGLDANSFSADALNRAGDNLRIISSLYGYLKPFDIIKPYRLEFNRPIFPDNKTSIATFKQQATINIVREIKSGNHKDIIDLLPGDADSVLDWKIIRAFSKVHKVCFKTINSAGSLVTPIAKTLKEHRGKMARYILEKGIESFQDLCSEESDEFVYSSSDSKPGLPVFIIAP